jgi:hypothetical protein
LSVMLTIAARPRKGEGTGGITQQGGA